MSKEAMKLALEVLQENHHLIEEYEHPDYLAHYDRVIGEVAKALAKQEQKRPQNCGTSYCSCIECVMDEQEQGEFVAVVEELPSDRGNPPFKFADLRNVPTGAKLYTTPQQRTWVGLTDEEANELWESTDSDWELMKRAEAKLKEKNT